MIVVITSGPEGVGQRHEITGVVEGMINMLVRKEDQILAISEGRVEFALWPEEVVEMFLVELVCESVRKEATS